MKKELSDTKKILSKEELEQIANENVEFDENEDANDFYDENYESQDEDASDLEENDESNSDEEKTAEESVEEEKTKKEKKSKKSKKDKENKTKKEGKIKKLIQSFKEKWHGWTKKQKIAFVAINTIITFLIVLGLTILIINIVKKDPVEEKPVIIENENYRYENGKLIFLDKKGKDIGSYECKNKDEKKCYVAILDGEDNFDIEKEIYEDDSPVLYRSSIYLNKYAFVYDNEKEKNGDIKLYDFKENKELGSYKSIKAYKSAENYIIGKDTEDKYGMILLTTNEVKTNIDFTYDYLGIVDEEKESKNVVVKSHDKWYLLNYNNQLVSKAFEYEIKNYNDKYVSCLNDKEYILYDYNGDRVWENNYDYINFYEDYIITIKDDNLNVYDESLNKVNAKDIVLDNNDYNIKNIYSGNINKRKLEDTLYAYKIKIERNVLTVEYQVAGEDKIYSINLLESKLNNTLQYINYSDGSLYIYQDLPKQVLLGSYKCSSKNEITAETSALSNCTIATDSYFSNNIYNNNSNPSVGYIPIFNNRFVFIYDNNHIVLYDLQNNKKLSEYSEVDTGTLTGNTNVSFSSETNKLVIAKNMKGNYGVIKINKDSVKGLISFNYTKIERFDQFYKGVTSTNQQVLLNSEGNEVTQAISSEIIKFHDDYLVAKENSLYYVYNFDGTKTNNNGYKFIELYDSYFAAVDNANKLNVYNYNDSNKKLFDRDIDLIVTSFNNQKNTSFSVDYSNGVYYVTVRNSAGGTAEIRSSATNTAEE